MSKRKVEDSAATLDHEVTRASAIRPKHSTMEVTSSTSSTSSAASTDFEQTMAAAESRATPVTNMNNSSMSQEDEDTAKPVRRGGRVAASNTIRPEQKEAMQRLATIVRATQSWPSTCVGLLHPWHPSSQLYLFLPYCSLFSVYSWCWLSELVFL